jgi:hypothetical protein
VKKCYLSYRRFSPFRACPLLYNVGCTHFGWNAGQTQEILLVLPKGVRLGETFQCSEPFNLAVLCSRPGRGGRGDGNNVVEDSRCIGRVWDTKKLRSSISNAFSKKSCAQVAEVLTRNSKSNNNEYLKKQPKE